MKLHGIGRVRQGVCPFHDEAEGSFTVYGPTRSDGTASAAARAATCWISSSGRSRCRSARALQLLGGGAATALPRAPLEHVPAVSELPARDPALLTAASRFYTEQLLRSDDALAYLSGRGIAVATAMALSLGYAPGVGLRESLPATGFDGERVARSGLFTERGSGTVRWHDRRARWGTWPCPMVGRASHQSRCPAPVSGVDGPQANPRLGAHPPRCPLGHRDRGDVRLADARAAGACPTCAALGTQGLERVAQAVSRFANVFVAFDKDDAGQAAAERLASLLERRAAIVRLPRDYLDVGELATVPDGRAAFLAQLRAAARDARS